MVWTKGLQQELKTFLAELRNDVQILGAPSRAVCDGSHTADNNEVQSGILQEDE